jgi:pimeloyl-ACP methyl ester carboxylesterase
VLPQLDAFALDLVESWANKEPVVVAGTSLGGCIALRLAEHPGNVRLAGVVPVSPDGLELPSWFDPIEEDPIVRKLLSIPVPVPGVLVRRARSSAYRQISYQHPSDTQRAVVDAFSRDGETRADLAMLLGSGRRLAPELSNAPFDLVGIRCPVLLVWGAHDRMLPHTDARIALDSLPTTHVELIEGAGHHPQLEATARLLELLLPFGT